MKIVLFGASGNIGQAIAAEATGRGHQVIGVVRDPARANAANLGIELLRGDVTDAEQVAALARGAGAIASAAGQRNEPGASAVYVAAARGLIAGATRAGVRRLVVVGGAGGLEVAPGVQAVDTPQFPEEWKGEALGQRDALGVYRAEGAALDWTYVAPAAHIEPGPRTGRFRVGADDRMLVGDDGQSRISIPDFAVGFVDELERARHPRQRITVAY